MCVQSLSCSIVLVGKIRLILGLYDRSRLIHCLHVFSVHCPYCSNCQSRNKRIRPAVVALTSAHNLTASEAQLADHSAVFRPWLFPSQTPLGVAISLTCWLGFRAEQFGTTDRCHGIGWGHGRNIGDIQGRDHRHHATARLSHRWRTARNRWQTKAGDMPIVSAISTCEYPSSFIVTIRWSR